MMQGRKHFSLQLFYQTSLEDLVPADNCYRKVNQALDFHFLYKSTQMHQKLTAHKAHHQRLVKRRSSTVEPVFGTLINHHNMKRINSRGISRANKHFLMANLSYNLRKYLKFSRPKAEILTPCMTLAKEMHFSIKLMLLEYLSFEYRLIKFQN